MRPALVACLLASAVVAAQTPQQPPVFRGGTTVVPLTVTVLDEKGVPVKDLKQSDFTVTENGRVREIVNFFPQNLVPGMAAPASDGLGPATRRTFLIVIGYGRIQVPTKAIDGAIDFVRNRALPQDPIALMAFHRVTPFTTDHEALARILERYKATHEQMINEMWEASLNNVKSLFGHPHYRSEDLVFGDMDGVLQGVGELRNASDLLYVMNRALRSTDKTYRPPDTFADVLDSLVSHGVDTLNAPLSLATLVLGSNRLKLYAGVEYLRDRDGEKHLVMLSGGGLASDADDAAVVARRAAGARVIVDMVDTAGGFCPPCRDIVDATGGYYTSLEMATKALAKLDQKTRYSYLLGYAPVNATLDGKFRDVKVKVNRPGVTVHFQHGYYAEPEPDPVELHELLIQARVEGALAYEQRSSDIPLTATVSPLPRIGIQSELRVEITIDAKVLGLPLVDEVRRGQLELQVYCGGAKEELIGQFGEKLDIKASDETYQAWLQDGIHRTVRVASFGPPKFVKVIVYDYVSDKVGSVIVTIK